jgi:hypothetical protein
MLPILTKGQTMKQRLDTGMVAHVWAQQEQGEGWNPQKNFFFRDSTIYSYRTTYPIARFVTNELGERAVLFRLDCYSTTTAKHIRLARHAVSGVPVFDVAHHIEARHDDNKASYQARIDELRAKAARARTAAEWHMRAAVALADQANAYAEFYGLRWRVEVPEFTSEFVAQVKARVAAASAAKAAATKAREETMRRERADNAREWWAGRAVSMWNYPDTLLRVKDGNVETSKGAEVPVEHAKRLWPIILRTIAAGVPYRRNGHSERVGQFTVDAIEVTGDIKVGCHYIKHAELARIAKELGL